MAIILASASPRREALLRQIGCSFEVITSDVIEDNSLDLPPEELALSHAEAKALVVAAKNGCDDIVIGADTIVVLGGQVYGKPENAADARRMLSAIAAKEHQVISAVAVVFKGKVWSDYCTTAVKIRSLTPEEIERYLATGEPMDKAGAYAIQGVGSLLVERIVGCYTNVVGLPLVTLDNLLRRSVGVGLL
jgi:septum formation protein